LNTHMNLFLKKIDEEEIPKQNVIIAGARLFSILITVK